MSRMTTIGMGAAVAALCVLGACEKDSGLPSKTSGKFRTHESEMLAQLPGGNVAIFGGNYMKLQGFMQQGPMARVMDAAESVSPGMKAWTECFLTGEASKLRMLGVVSYQDDVATMTYVMRGFGVPQVEACAKKASFPTAVDPDGKFITIDVPNPMGEQKLGYLVLPDGALLTSQVMPFPPGSGKLEASTRADLEAIAAAAARGNASADTALIAEAAGIDRDRAIWFAANLNGTPAADKVGLMRGWVDVDGGLDMDLNVQITDGRMAKELEENLPKLKGQADMLGRDVAEVVRALRYQRKGDRFRFGLKISNAQIEKLMSQMGGMLGGGGF